MSTGKNDNRKTSSLYTVIYIAAVLILAGCIAFLLWNSRKRNEEFARRVEEIAQDETEYVLVGRPHETETEAVTEAPAGAGAAGQTDAGTPQSGAEAQNESGAVSQTESGAGSQAESGAGSQAESSAGSQAESSAGSQAESSAGSQAESGAGSRTDSGVEITTGDLQASILVLNGTRKPGVAAYWQSVLLADGYSNVSMATYSQEASDRTVIYYSGEPAMHAALTLQAYFPDTDIIYGAPADEIEPGGDTQIPAQIDVYIVVGLLDAEAAETEETTAEQQTLPEGQAAGLPQAAPDGQTTGPQQTTSGGQQTGQQISPDGQLTEMKTFGEDSRFDKRQQAARGKGTRRKRMPFLYVL